MKQTIRHILLSILFSLILVLCIGGLVFWGEFFSNTKYKIMVHQGYTNCNCGTTNIVDSVTFEHGNMTMHFGKAKGTAMHFSTWVDTLTIKTYHK